jgi:hypothetical protein
MFAEGGLADREVFAIAPAVMVCCLRSSFRIARRLASDMALKKSSDIFASLESLMVT